MNTAQPDFIEGFVKACYHQGLSPESATDMLLAAQLLEQLEDPDFRAGLDTQLKKIAAEGASVLPFTPVPDVLNAAQQGLTSGAKGLGIGAGLGALGGLAMKRIPGASMLKHLALPTGVGAAGGALFGGVKGVSKGWEARNPPTGPAASSVFIPPYLRGSSAPSTPAAAPGAPNIFTTPTSLTTGGSSPASAAPRSSMHGILDANQGQIEALDKAITEAQAKAQAALGTTGLKGSLEHKHLQKQIMMLQRQKQQALAASNATTGAMARDQRQSVNSITAAQDAVSKALKPRELKAEKMDQWLRAHPNRGMLYSILNRITGAEGKAQKLQAEMDALNEQASGLNDWRQKAETMLAPGTGAAI